jgi:hypothetical protein
MRTPAAEGCEIPARLCEIHHTGGGWKAGIPTNIDRLAPLRSFHNKWVEEHPRRIQETEDDEGRFVIRCLPPWEPHPEDQPPEPPELTDPPGDSRPSGPETGPDGDTQPQGP